MAPFTNAFASWLAETVPAPTNTDNSKVALYGMIGVIVVALIAGVVNLMTSRSGASRGAVPAPNSRQAKREREHDAWERFLIRECDVDPRKIKTGYEAMSDVRNA